MNATMKNESVDEVMGNCGALGQNEIGECLVDVCA